ncbi:MAG: sulfatase-like hydrolase/transferase [Akkermansia sp.]
MKTIVAGTLALLAAVPLSALTRAAENKKPNILFIITDDHAYQTLGTGKDDSPVALPNFNKLGRQGMVFDRSYCANSLCGPSRACILTGRHYRTASSSTARGRWTLPAHLPEDLAKSRLPNGPVRQMAPGIRPTGFDTWEIFPGQGDYYNPDFISLKPNGKRQTKRFPGYATDVVTDKSIQWLENRDKDKPPARRRPQGPQRPCPALRHLGKVDTSG